eukprot:2028950-Rhodomonas_salina.2
MSGTDIAYARRRPHGAYPYQYQTKPVLSPISLRAPYAMPEEEEEVPDVDEHGEQVETKVLPESYGMSGTDIVSASEHVETKVLPPSYEMSGTDIEYSRLSLKGSYAIPGTDTSRARF